MLFTYLDCSGRFRPPLGRCSQYRLQVCCWVFHLQGDNPIQPDGQVVGCLCMRLYQRDMCIYRWRHSCRCRDIDDGLFLICAYPKLTHYGVARLQTYPKPTPGRRWHGKSNVIANLIVRLIRREAEHGSASRAFATCPACPTRPVYEGSSTGRVATYFVGNAYQIHPPLRIIDPKWIGSLPFLIGGNCCRMNGSGIGPGKVVRHTTLSILLPPPRVVELVDGYLQLSVCQWLALRCEGHQLHLMLLICEQHIVAPVTLWYANAHIGLIGVKWNTHAVYTHISSRLIHLRGEVQGELARCLSILRNSSGN